MNYVQKIKLRNLSKDEEGKLVSLCDISRFTYNFILARTLDYFRINKKKPSLKIIYDFKKEFRSLVRARLIPNKDGEVYPEEFQDLLRGAPSQIVDMECKNLFQAWKTLRKRDYPSFKRISDSKQSFTLHKKTNTTFKFLDSTISVAKMDFHIPKGKNRFLITDDQIKRVTIIKSAYGWYLAILLEIPDSTFTLPKLETSIGIDWGVSKFATDSEGYQIDFKDFDGYKNYIKISERLKVLQSKLSKKRNKSPEWKKSVRYLKLKNKVAWCYENLANIRKSFIHLVSIMYIRENQTIVLENLKPANMMKNHKLARSIAQAMFYTWKITLQYKADFYGREVILIDPKNTSQTCSNCDTKLKEKLKLSERTFKCDNCGIELDRDYNAAINILNKA